MFDGTLDSDIEWVRQWSVESGSTGDELDRVLQAASDHISCGESEGESWRVGDEWWLEGVLYRELLDAAGDVAGYLAPDAADEIAASLNARWS